MMEEEDEDVLFDQADIDSGDDRIALLSDKPLNVETRPESHNIHHLGPTRCFKIFSTICLCAAFLGLGLCIAIPGPTLLDLQQQTNTDTKTISRLFTGRSVGYLLGSIISGVLFDKLNQPCLLSLSLLLTAGATAAAPWCSKFFELVIVFAFQGASMGFLDTGGNVMCVQTWGEGNAPWMQTLHFSFGIGAFVAPLIAEPFLSNSMNQTFYLPNDTYNNSFSVPDIDHILTKGNIRNIGKTRHVREVQYFDDDKRFINDNMLDMHNNIEKRALKRNQNTNMNTNRRGTLKKSKKESSSRLSFFVRKPIQALGLVDAITQKLLEALQKLHKEKNSKLEPPDTNNKNTGEKPAKETTQAQPSEKPKERKPLHRPRPKRPKLKGLPLGFDEESENPNLGDKKEIEKNKNDILKGNKKVNNGGSNITTVAKPINKTGVIKTMTLFEKLTQYVSYTPTEEFHKSIITPSKPRRVRPRPNRKNYWGILPKSGVNSKLNISLTKVDRSDNSSFSLVNSSSERKKIIHIISTPPVDNSIQSLRSSANSSAEKKEKIDIISTPPVNNGIPKATVNATTNLKKDNKIKRPRPGKSNKFLPGGYSDKSNGNNNFRSKRAINSNPNSTVDEIINDVNGTNNRTMEETTTKVSTPAPVNKNPNRPHTSGGSGKLSNSPDVAGSKINKKLQHNEPTKKETKSSLTKTTTTTTTEKTDVNGTLTEDNNSTLSNITAVSSKSILTTTNKPTTPTTTTVKTTTIKPTTKAIVTPTTKPKTKAIITPTTKSVKPHDEHIVVAATTVSSQNISYTDVDNVTMTTQQQPNQEEGKGSIGKVKDAINYVVVSFNSVINGLTMVQFAYLTIAIYLFFVGFLLIILCCKGNCSLWAIKLTSSTQPQLKKKESKGFRIQLLILLFIFFFLYVGMEITYGGLLLTFVVEKLGWSKSQGSLITAAFFGSFAAGRGLSIFLAKCLSPTVILILDLVLTSIGLIGLLICIESNPTMIWYFNVILGLGMSSIFPTGVSWAEQYVGLTGKATAIFVVGSALGEMLLPAFTGFMFQQKGHMWLLYTLTGCALISIVIYIIMQNLASNSGGKYEKVSKYRDVTLSDLDHSVLEMESIPLTPDLEGDEEPLMGSNSHTSSGYYEQNGSVGKSRKKVTFNFSKNDSSKARDEEGGHAKSKSRGSILKMKGSIKKD